MIETLIESGWTDASEELPDNDRTVQVAWEDGSYGERSLAFCDSIAGGDGERVWWSHPKASVLPRDSVLAWREVVRQE